jgi:tricorn protease
MDSGAGTIVFEQAGYIHELDPKTGKSKVLNINVTGDFPWMMPRWEDVSARMTNIELSPTGKARIGRVAGRDLYDPRREGRHAKPY